MTAVLISYDLNSPGQTYDKLIEKIESYGTYAKVLKSTWIVAGPYLSAQGVYDALHPLLDSNDHIFCVEIDGKERQGWLPKAIWEWIRKQV
ncbi:hypothetical protein [Clavibacter michiganensis]|uniref:hypothetical protein n=1 Tax=Clavibacter michiganensis TaxID=28447 RepID=UPI0013654700|nr:hypothetical protein [Clavibacter michiganensis]MBT1636854.1 hypothetical protein [Clavibacter michiganensis]MDO4138360.1 hypothetical protein [Clavibacter michiganensis]MWJ49292.1 hypothetical protein [Clavibacter michiganensis subsp. michiganensis]